VQAFLDHMGQEARHQIRKIPGGFDLMVKPAFQLYQIGCIQKQQPDVAQRDRGGHYSSARKACAASQARSGASNQYSCNSGSISVSIT